MSEIEEIARDLVALWQNPKIQSLSRAGRNSAIEETRDRLINSVLAHSSVGSEHGISNPAFEGSNPSAPTTNAPVAKQVDAEGLNPLHLAGSSPARGTTCNDIVERLRRWESIRSTHILKVMREAADEIDKLRAELSRTSAGNADLRHDLERHIEIASSETQRAEAAEARLAEAMKLIDDRLKEYAESDERSDLTELGDHAYLVLRLLRSDLEFVLNAPVGGA